MLQGLRFHHTSLASMPTSRYLLDGHALLSATREN